MTVMNFAAYAAATGAHLDQRDALAVRNAFLKYDLDEQAQLLAKMPLSEA